MRTLLLAGLTFHPFRSVQLGSYILCAIFLSPPQFVTLRINSRTLKRPSM